MLNRPEAEERREGEDKQSALTKSTYNSNLTWEMRNVKHKMPLRRTAHLYFLSGGKFELLHKGVSVRAEGSTF